MSLTNETYHPVLVNEKLFDTGFRDSVDFLSWSGLRTWNLAVGLVSGAVGRKHQAFWCTIHHQIVYYFLLPNRLSIWLPVTTSPCLNLDFLQFTEQCYAG